MACFIEKYSRKHLMFVFLFTSYQSSFKEINYNSSGDEYTFIYAIKKIR